MPREEPVGPDLAESSIPDAIQSSVRRMLDEHCKSFADGRVSYFTLAEMVDNLGMVVSEAGSASWVPALRMFAQRHPISEFIYQCPFTMHSKMRPRGYEGDAVLLDFIYEHSSVSGVVASASDLGRSILAHNLQSPAPTAVRTRRLLLADRLTEMALTKNAPRVLAVASGHVRELELLSEKVRGRIGEFIALDQDEESLKVAAQQVAGSTPVRAISASIMKLIEPSYDIGGFDYIYAAGLYDYLPDRLSKRLTQRLFERLLPGGKLLVANFLPKIRDVGYMEIFMDWSLIYRDAASIRTFADLIDRRQVDSLIYQADPYRNVGYLEIGRCS